MEEEEQQTVTLYRCRKCRQIVATQESVQSHAPGAGSNAFPWRKRRKDSETVDCASVFVEPLKWMSGVQDGAVEGKLFCTCQAKLGTFNWAGTQCNCGAWVNPAFQLHKGRLDVMSHSIPASEKLNS